MTLPEHLQNIPPQDYEEEILDMALTFIWTEELTRETHKKTRITPLREGDYHGIKRRKYREKQYCDGCQTSHKAKVMLILQDKNTGQHVQIGMQCLKKYYGVDLQQVETRLQQTGHTRRTLASRMRLKNLSFEQMVETIWQLVRLHVPEPSKHLPFIERAREDFMASDHTVERLGDLFELALYHKEWQEYPHRAKLRYQALMHHPKYLQVGGQAKIQQVCEQLIRKEGQLDEQEIAWVLKNLRSVQGYTDPRSVLAHPQDFPNKEAYEKAVKERLQARVDSLDYDDGYWTGLKDDRTKYVSPRGPLHSVIALHPPHTAGFAEELRQEKKFYKSTVPYVITGKVTSTYTAPPVMGVRRDDMGRDESYVRIKATPFPFKVVGIALVERYTPTHALWHQHGREKLDYLTSVLDYEDQQ